MTFTQELRGWSTKLLNEKRPNEINLHDANVEDDDLPLALALLLDAAWLARVGITADQDADDIDAIASGAVELLLKAIEPPVGRTIYQPNVAGRTGE